MDASGNAVMNVLSVVGIDASWINADNLSAISSNLGGWEINDDAIYKQYTSSSLGWIFHLWIRPPKPSGSTRAFVQVDVSTDGGNTFNTWFSLTESNIVFRNYLSNLIASTLGNGKLYLYDASSGAKVDFNVSTKTCNIEKMTLTADEIFSSAGYTGSVTLSGVRMTFSGGILTSATNV